MIRRPLALGLFAVLAAACGARSELFGSAPPAGGGGDGGDVTSSSSRGSSTSTGGSGGGGGGAGPCRTWSFASSQPTRLTELDGDMGLTGATADGADVLVATTNNNDPSPDPSWRVRVLSQDLAMLGLSQGVLSRAPSGVSFSGLSLATSTTRGGIAWDEAHGCRFVGLGDGGVPTGITTVAPSWCYWLTPRDGGGFLAFVSSALSELGPLDMFVLDPTGNVVETHPGIVPAQNTQTYPADRAKLADGTVMLSWLLGTSTVVARRFDQSGQPLSDVRQIASGSAIELRMAAVGAGAMIAWTPDAAQGGVLAQTVDVAGNVGPENALVASGASIRGIDIVGVPGGALVGWMAPTETTSLLTVQPVTPAGAPMGPPLTNILPPFGGSVVLVATPNGAMVVFEAEEPGQPEQVYALALTCSG